MKKIAFITFLFLLIGCDQPAQVEKPTKNNSQPPVVKTVDIVGLWRGVLLSPGGELPFGIDIIKENNQYTAKIINGEERADTSKVELNDNNITINFDWFDARIKATIDEDGQSMTGQWSKTASGKDKTSALDFKAMRGYKQRFSQESLNSNNTKVAGNWEVTFTDEDGESIAVAEFNQNDEIVTGTFLTPTGDYRYLAGTAKDNKLYLSAFDGAHAFLFDAEINDDKIINGNFWSRDSYHATWVAQYSEDTSDFLPSSWEMNKITTNDQSVSFSFEDIQGNTVQLTDERFKNKPVLINLFGTWCPNCNDEAPVLAKFYNQYNPQGLEMVGLAFEFTEDPVRDRKQLSAFKKRHNINYPLLLAGGNDKTEATKILGFLDKVKSYPTTLFLDKNHQVVKIHTGFSGPGTGDHYLKLVEELETEIKNLLSI
ncbi:MAG: TlpA disulfide reductase family protein [Marinicellaceae bacterium]